MRTGLRWCVGQSRMGLQGEMLVPCVQEREVASDI